MFSFLLNFYAESLQVLKEMRVAFADMLNTAEREAATTAERDDCQSHEQAVVVVTIDHYTAFDALGIPLHDNSVPAGSDRTAGSLQFKAQIIDTIGFFIVEMLYIVKCTIAISEARERYQGRYTIDGMVSVHLNTP